MYREIKHTVIEPEGGIMCGSYNKCRLLFYNGQESQSKALTLNKQSFSIPTSQVTMKAIAFTDLKVSQDFCRTSQVMKAENWRVQQYELRTS